MMQRVLRQSPFTFMPRSDTVTLNVNGSGGLKSFRLLAELSPFDYTLPGTKLELFTPHAAPIDLTEDLGLDDLFVSDGQGGLMIEIDSQRLPSLMEEIEGQAGRMAAKTYRA